MASAEEEARGGNVPFHVTCVERRTASSASTGPVNNQQDNSQRLSSKITTMSVCLTSAVTSPVVASPFFSLPLFPPLPLPL